MNDDPEGFDDLGGDDIDLEVHNPIRKKRSSHIYNRKVYYDGEYIFHKGEEAYTAYFIENGHAEVIVEDQDHEVVLGTLGPGDIFGEMAIIDPAPRSASVRAVKQCTVIVISQMELETKIELIDNKPVQSLFKFLIRRLRRANEEQFSRSKQAAHAQAQIMNLIENLAAGIPEQHRESFKDDILPLVEKMEAVVEKYAFKDEFVYGPEDINKD